MTSWAENAAEAVAVLIKAIPIVLGAALTYGATSLHAKRERKKLLTDRTYVELKEQRVSDRQNARETIELVLKIQRSLLERDEQVVIDRRRAERSGEVNPVPGPENVPALDAVGPDVLAWLQQLESLYAVQLPDPERRRLVEIAVDGAIFSIQGPDKGQNPYMRAGMRRVALRYATSILRTYLSGESVNQTEKDWLENTYAQVWGSERFSPKSLRHS